MTIQVELDGETEVRLVAAAQARGIAVDKYAGNLLREAMVASPAKSGKLTLDELQIMLREIAEGAEKLPRLATSAFSRQSFCEGRL